MRFYEITLLSLPEFVFAWSVDTRKHRNYFDHKPDFLEISVAEEGRSVAEHPDGTKSIHYPGMLGMITSDMSATCYAYNGERIRHTTAAVRVKYDLRIHDSEESCDIPALKQRVKTGHVVLLPIGVYLEESYDDILNILKKIVTLHASQTPSDRLSAVGQWYQLLAAVTDFTLRQLDAAESALPPSELSYCAKAVRYIDLNYTQKLTVEMIAEDLGISAGYLHRIFKRVEGCSVLAYWNRKRVDVAIELMEKQQLSLKEAAFNVGIEDPAYMSRLFKKTTGLSVREYFREKRVNGWVPR